MATEDKLNHLIGVLYETAIDPSRWSEAMELCARYAGGIAAHMLTIDKRFNQPVFSVHGGEFATQENESDYVDHYMNIDPRMTSGMMDDAVVHEWRFCHAYFDKQFVSRNEFYQDFLIPIGGRYVMAAWVNDGLEQHTVIGLHRAVDQPLFGDAERAAAQHFSGHLQRALRLQAHTQSLQVKAELGARTIETLVMGKATLIVDAKAGILHLNAGAEHLLNTRSCELVCKSGRLFSSNPQNQAKLATLIAEATGCPAVGGAMLLPGSEIRQVFVAPMPAASRFAQDWQIPLVLVLVEAFGNTSISEDAYQHFAKSHRLTRQETKVLQGIVEGFSAKEIAERHAVSYNTVRSQLASLMQKTDCRRQKDLIRLFLRDDAGQAGFR